MADPNVLAAKGNLKCAEEFEASVAMGLLPIALKSSQPTIIFRWGIEHIIAPMRLEMGKTRKGVKLDPSSWRDGIWVGAWVYALFKLKDAFDIFTNSWTSVQENKPRILELKMAYDEALKDPEKRLLILTEFRMGLEPEQRAHRIAADAGMKQVQKELDKLERSDVHPLHE